MALTIGKISRFRAWRLDRGYSLDEIADVTGISKSMLSRFERGERALAPSTRIRVARRLEVPVRELFDVEPLGDLPAPDDDAP